VVEQVAFEARADKRIDQRSGVSQRLPISLLELAVSNAERRAMTTDAGEIVPRLEDVFAALPAITGKLELEYEGELQGADTIAQALIRRAVGRIFDSQVGEADCDGIIDWFEQGGALKLSDNQTAEASHAGFTTVPGLVQLVDQVGLAAPGDIVFSAAACEFILEGLTAHKRISKDEAIGYNRQPTKRREPPPGPGFGLG
jgi:magnesium chelatase subunit I